ncbi:MAG: trypsin-like peptidase domain-containing protein [Candidatus Acidiferrales bacterium]
MTEAAREKIVIVDSDEARLREVADVVRAAGYEVLPSATAEEGLQSIQAHAPDVVLLGDNLAELDRLPLLSELRGSAATQAVRVIVMAGGDAAERARWLDLGADDVVSRPVVGGELLARIRKQLQARRTVGGLRQRAENAEEMQKVSQTAFQALAVTEKMTKDAFTLDRALKIGVAAVFIIAAVMAGIFFLFSHGAQKQQKLAAASIARLEQAVLHQQDLIAQSRKFREAELQAASPDARATLQQRADALKQQMANAPTDQVSQLQKELGATDARLKKLEQQGQSAQNLIPADVSGVCLIHVSVGFRQKSSGARLRFAGLNAQGDPIQDSDGNPIITTEGRGPEVRVEVLGTGFLAAPGGRVITNHHVAQPWWKDDDMQRISAQGAQPEIATLRVYFPGVPEGFAASIHEISKDADLASLDVDLGGRNLPILSLDAAPDAAKSGESVVSMGYATGLAALLARADETTVREIVAAGENDASRIIEELAKRKLIRPLITQGHIGDVLPEKIVFDAQTTSGGSGGPLFNHDGKVIGVTYAVLKDFGGSNLGIPIRFSEPLLTH